MPLTLADFWKRCLASGLTDAATPRKWAAAYAQDHQSSPPNDPLKLAKWLISTKRVLPFQASSLIHGSPDIPSAADGNSSPRIPKLRIAPITQSADSPPDAFPKWLAATHDDKMESSGEKPGSLPPGLLWQVDPRRLSPEDGDRLRQMVATRDNGLPDFDLVALPDGPLGTRALTVPINEPFDAVGLYARLPDGESLADSLKARSQWPIAEIVSLLESLAGPLRTTSLSMKPVLSADHVWMRKNGAAMLWIDPHEQLASLSGDRETSIRRTESRLLYAAPELLSQVSQSAADERSIVYALGCLGYRLRTSNHAFAAAKDEQIRSRQLNFNPPELAVAVQKGAEGEPFFRVLAYALSKDPAARFATIDSFLVALRATVPAEAESEAAAPAKSKPIESKPDVTKSVSKDAEGAPKSSSPAPTPTKQKQSTSTRVSEQPVAKTKPQPSKTKPVPAQQMSTKRDSRKQTDVEPPTKTLPANSQSLVGKAGKTNPTSTPIQPAASTPLPAEAASSVAPEQAVTTEHAVAAAPAETQANENLSAETDDWVAPAPRRRPSRRRSTWFVLHSLWIPIFLLIVANALQAPKDSRQTAKRVRPAIPAVIPSVAGKRPPPPRPKPAAPAARTKDSASSSAKTIEVVENAEMLWAPPSWATPSAGQPESAPEKPSIPATALLPPGPAAVVTIDYANLIATGLADTFSPEIATALDALKKRIGIPLDDVRLITMAWFPGVDGIPSVAVAVHLHKPQSVKILADLWGASEAMGKGGVKLFASDDPDGFAYYPSTLSSNPIFESDAEGADSLVTAFAVGTIDQITDVAEVEGAPVLLPRLLEQLWDHSDPTDAIALLTQPNFLVADARGWVDGLAPPLLDWIRKTLIPECGGILLRVAATDNRSSYVEARLASAPGMDPTRLRNKIGDRLKQAPSSADDFLVSREVDPSWRLLASRLPTMWAFAGDQTRSMVIDRDVVFNSYLPPMALPQLTLATLLASNTTAMTAVAGSDPAGEKLSIEQMLDRPMSVSFGQESMQFAVDNITAEFTDGLPKGNTLPPVEIIGGDLQLMGITQNQQIRDFEKTDVPLRTVLTDLVLGANPDKTATGPSDPKQALVWVVVGEGTDTKILITTREASKGKYTLPKEFVVK